MVEKGVVTWSVLTDSKNDGGETHMTSMSFSF